MSVHRLKRNFTSGELSLMLSTRVELERYKNGCELIENMYVTTQGPAIRRPGTKFIYDMTALFGEIDETFKIAKSIREIPFIFSEVQSYDLTFYRNGAGHSYVIFGYKDGIVEDPNSPGQPYKVDLGTDFDVMEFDYAQSGDILFIASSTHTQAKLSRFGHTDWRYEDISFTDPPTDWGAGGTPVPWPVTAINGNPYELIIDNHKPPTLVVVGDILLFYDINSADPADQVKLDEGLAITEINGNYVHCAGVDGNLLSVSPTGGIIIVQKYVQVIASFSGQNDLTLTLTTNPFSADDIVDLHDVYSVDASDNETLSNSIKIDTSTGLDISFTTIAGRNVYFGLNPRAILAANNISVAQEDLQGTPHQMYVTLTGHGLSVDDYALFFGLTSSIPDDTEALQGQLKVVEVNGDIVTINDIDGGRVSFDADAVAIDAETAKGFPTKVSFFEQRLMYASSKTKPQTIWGSKSGDFYDFGISATLVESDAITFTLASGQQNKIQWLLSSRRLLIGTLGDEWSLGGYNAPLSYKSIVATRQTNQGSEPEKPIMIGAATLFIERLGRTINEFIYDYNSDSYGTIDVTLLAPHLLRNDSVLHWSYQQTPHGIVWAIRSDGDLLGFTYQRKHKVMGWHRHSTEGLFLTTAAVPAKDKREDEIWFTVMRYVEGKFRIYKEKLAVEFKGTNLFDAEFVDSFSSHEVSSSILIARIVEKNLELIVEDGRPIAVSEWVQVKGIYTLIPDVNKILTRPLRVISYSPSPITGYMTVVLDLEGAAGEYEGEDLPVPIDVFYSGIQVTYLGDKVTYGFTVKSREEPQIVTADAKVYQAFDNISGLDHLEEKEVHILLNGAVSPPQIVHDGKIALPVTTYRVTVGLAYTSTLIPYETDLELATGTTLGRNQRVTQISVKLLQSVGMEIGRKIGEMEEIPFRVPSDLTGQAVPLFSGWVHKSFPEGYMDKTQIIIQQTQPLPLVVVGTVDEVEVYDRYRS